MFGLHVVEQSSNEDFLPKMREISYKGVNLQQTCYKISEMWNSNPNHKSASSKRRMIPL